MRQIYIRHIVLCLCLLTGINSFAYDAYINGIYYDLQGNNAIVTGGSGNSSSSYSGDIIIPNSVSYNGKLYSVTRINNYTFRFCTSLTSVTIPNSVTIIGYDAFYGCSGLASVTIPNSVTIIGSSAFSGCSSLTSITIPESVTSIAYETFSGCSSLTSVIIPNSVTSIGYNAFSGCSGLAAVTIPENVTSIGSGAFSGCSSLTSVTIPNSVTSIDRETFYKCSSLTSVTIPENVTSIGNKAFYGCSGLTSVTIPENVTSIGSYAFYQCSSLTSVTIPNSVTTINDCVFANCSSLTSITIPENVTSIGNSAFFDCSSLTSVTIPNSVTSIGDGAFYGCRGLTSVTIPEGVISIGESMFSQCTGLASVSIPNSVTSIGKGAFDYCKNLVSVIIGSNVTNIGENAIRTPKMIICYAAIPPTIAENAINSSVTSVLYVPRASIERYKNADVWKTLSTISAIEDYENSIPLIVCPSFGQSDLLFYDYDGDGVMEMLSQYSYEKSYNKMEYGYALLSDSAKIANVGSFSFSDALRVANGNGDISIGNVIFKNDGELGLRTIDVTRNCQSSPYIYYNNTDLDNDGNVDMVSVNNNGITMLKSHPGDDMYEKSVVRIVQDSAYLAYLKSLEKKYNPLVSGMSVVSGSTGPTSIGSGVSRTIDLNGDGWLDILSSDRKSACMSLAGNGYYRVMFTGEIYPYDLDGNGILDYLLYDGKSVYTVITDASGQSTQKRIFDNTGVKNNICRDFDHDGDVDVLVYITDGTYTYFTFMRNDGNGTFKKKEDYLEGEYTFKECRDYDADGLYEVLLWNVKTDSDGKLVKTPAHKLVKVNSNFTLTDVSENFTGNEPANSLKMYMGDYDSDGYTDLKLTKLVADNNSYRTTANIFMIGHYSKQTKRNSAPQKMLPPSVALDEKSGYLRIAWERGEDAETSSCDLTYEVRIGTAPGKGDILYALSLPDGRRRVIEEGSMGTQLQTLFNIGAHPAGTYYVSVQAIDAGGLGGAWSEEAIYEHHSTTPLIMANTLSTTTVDTITVMANMYDESASYHWVVTNGNVISQKQNSAQVTFNAAGTQQVMLTLKIGQAEYTSEPLSIVVNAFKYQVNSAGKKVEIKNMPRLFFDINQDGYPDGISSYFLVNDGKGNFSKYPKSFNSNLSFSSPAIFDKNRDGYPDVISSAGTFVNDEEGDFEKDPDLKLTGNVLNVDFTNTGKNARLDGPNILTTDDYYNWSTTMLYLPNVECTICDINRDGFMDVVYRSNPGIISAYINNGDENFQKTDLLVTENGIYKYKVADINNDGYLDIIISCTGSYKPFYIYLGQPDNTFHLALEICNKASEIESVRDFDNDGYLDLYVRTADGNSYIYFKQNLQYEIVADNEMVCTDDPFVVLDGNGYPQGWKGTAYSYRAMSTIKNESPKAPAMVTAKQTADGMVINWADAEDDHTPAVQMRYNVSVKRKGKTGEGSYVISPMNGGSSQAAPVFPYYYRQSTIMTVPASVLTAGETYEVQVQAIDLWNQWSPMTEPVEITITAEDGRIEAPDMACVGRETRIKYYGALSWDATIDFGKDSKYTENGATFIVTWNSAGAKNITIGNLHSQILVKNPVDVSFTLPEEIFTGSQLPIAVSKEMAALVGNAEFHITSAPAGASYEVNYTPGANTALLKVNKAGNYELEAVAMDALIGNSYKVSFNAQEAPKAEINRVDAEDGHYVIRWGAAGLPGSIKKAILYKEGISTNHYNVLDTVDVSSDAYTDVTSSPQTMSARYKLALLTDGGQTIESKAHMPLHVMIGASAAGGYNLMWNAYEGRPVDNYRIWRGTSADGLQLVAQVAGSQQSYTDTSAPSGEVFYAVSFTPTRNVAQNRARRISALGDDIISNVVSTRTAANIIQANNLSIITIESNPCLTDEKPTLQLYSLLLPTYCTFDKVAWSIVEGEELATISSNGLLTGIGGKGTVTVRARSLDGSNLTAEISIPIEVTDLIDEINRVSEDIEVTSVGLRWFTISGKMLPKRPESGIYIEVEFLSDGTIHTRKITVK